MPSTSCRLMPVVVCSACVVLGGNSGMSGTPGHPASSEFGFTISRFNGGRRGSSRWQHTLHGHWARQREEIEGRSHPGQALRAVLWRNTAWWRGQQNLSPSVSMRHPRRFYASNPERQLAQSHGGQWTDLARDRHCWSCARKQYIADWDVPWCNGRQLSICF